MFIRPSQVIKRLRETIDQATQELDIPPNFITYGDRVGGSGYISEIVDTDIQNLPTPSIFVVLSDVNTITNEPLTVDQNIFHGFTILVVLDTIDSRKQTAEEKVVTFKELLIYCLNGWHPNGNINGNPATPLRFIGDASVYTDRTKYVRAFNFEQDYHFSGCSDKLVDATLDNFESFFADLLTVENEQLITKAQVTDMYDENGDSDG